MLKKLNFKSSFFLSIKNSNRGFTLIELLVVIILVGILTAIAFPNLIKKVSKAREVEIKIAVGTVNRAQQAYHYEKGSFALGENENETISMLNVNFDNHYIDDYNIVVNGNSATIAPDNFDYHIDQTKAYSGGIFYSFGTYSTIVCESLDSAQNIPAPSDADNCVSSKLIR